MLMMTLSVDSVSAQKGKKIKKIDDNLTPVCTVNLHQNTEIQTFHYVKPIKYNYRYDRSQIDLPYTIVIENIGNYRIGYHLRSDYNSDSGYCNGIVESGMKRVIPDLKMNNRDEIWIELHSLKGRRGLFRHRLPYKKGAKAKLTLSQKQNHQEMDTPIDIEN